MDAHVAHNDFYRNGNIFKIGNKKIKVIRDPLHLLQNFGNRLINKEKLSINGTEIVLEGNYNKKVLRNKNDIITFFSEETFQKVYAKNTKKEAKNIFMAIVDLLKYLINETSISEVFKAVLRNFDDLFKNIDNNIMYMANLAEVLLNIIEECNIQLTGSLSTIEAEKLFYARSGKHYNEQIMNYRRQTNYQTSRYNFLHEVIINTNLQTEAYNKETQF
jgi:hypothetical protein